jgi:hypothetical protein
MADDISATPVSPARVTNQDTQLAARGGIKPATPDLIIFNQDAVPVDAMADLIFEDIGGHELINMLNHDTVNGKNINYSLISNSAAVAKSYSPNNIIFTPGTINEFFKNFAIRLDTHQPETKEANRSDILYIDRITSPGSLVIEFTKMEKNEQVEVQILNSGEYLDGII